MGGAAEVPAPVAARVPAVSAGPVPGLGEAANGPVEKADRKAGRPPCRPEVAKRILALRRQDYSLQQIADLLNVEGVPPPMGRSPWRKSHVCDLLGRLYVRELENAGAM